VLDEVTPGRLIVASSDSRCLGDWTSSGVATGDVFTDAVSDGSDDTFTAVSSSISNISNTWKIQQRRSLDWLQPARELEQ